MNPPQNDSNPVENVDKPEIMIPKVGYVFNRELLRLANGLPQVQGRAQLVHCLIGSYRLLHKCRHIAVPRPCSRTELLAFHTESFLEYVSKNSCKNDLELSDRQEQEAIEHQKRKGLKRSGKEKENSKSILKFEKETIKDIVDDIEKQNKPEVAAESMIKDNICHISQNENDTEHEIMLNDSPSELTLEDNPFGFGYDCPLIVELYDTIAYLAGASIAGARSIIDKKCHYCINWFGGWHHAHRDEVSGYCYTNDIVFAILEFLRAGYKRILYIDLDLHHGDGVEDAFAHTNKVVTLSFHKHELGFFPGSGGIIPQNADERNRYSSLNVPLKNGLVDEQFVWIFKNVLEKLLPKMEPEVIICQCGADGLSGDRMQSFSLTESSFKECISLLLSKKYPILFLGGGGYNLPNTARLWTILTGMIVGDVELDSDIPEHEYFLHYGPGYELSISQSFLPNRNSQEDLQGLLDQISEHIRKLSL